MGTGTVTAGTWSTPVRHTQDGANGTNGADGAPGAAGATGTKGDTGATGADGATGPQGPKGDKGDPGSSGGTSIVTNDARIKVENITVPNTGGWAIVTSSGGTPLQCSIKAAINDRIVVAVEMMRTGGGSFLDKAILTSAGGLSVYAGSGTSTPLDEGAPAYYPQANVFPQTSGSVQFVVQAGQVDGSGNITVAMVYKGAGSGTTIIYASATYPWYMLLTNIGPATA